MKQIRPCLWFDGQAEAAAEFYISVFKNGKILEVSCYSDVGQETHGQDAGTVLTVEFEINGQSYTALNGGPQFKFSEAISFQIDCQDQTEVDYYWNALLEGGEASQCGWLKDQFGLSWQVVPTILGELLSDPDRAKADRVMAAMMEMKKIDIAVLQQASEA